MTNHKTGLSTCLKELKQNLDAKRPTLVANSTHAMIVFGYDNTKDKTGVPYTWNQRIAPRMVSSSPLHPSHRK